MRAVNLIPVDQRSTTRNVGKSGGAAYALVGLLGILALAVVALTMTGRHTAERQANADALESQAAAALSQAGALASYKTFAALAATRTSTVRDLAETRSDWGRTLDQVSQVIPADVALNHMGVTTSPAAQGAGVSLRTAMENPAIELVGCATSQDRVALLMARLRRIDGVVRVSLSSSDKADTAANTSATAVDSANSADATDCTAGSDQHPQFQLVAFLAPKAAAPTAATPASASAGTQAALDAAKDTTATPTTATPAPATTTPTTTPAPAASGS